MTRSIAGPIGGCGLALGLLCGVASAQARAGTEASGTPASSAASRTDSSAMSPTAPSTTSSAARPTASSDGLLDFDIPAQPLEDALLRYGTVTEIPAIYPSEQMAGLNSNPVRGRYTPEEALRRLLAGTGLVLEKMTGAHGTVFRLKRIAGPALANDAGSARAHVDLDGYPARLQAGVLRSLCADARTAPGRYRAMLQVSVDAIGEVSQTKLLDSTGDTQRDAALLAAVSRVRTEPPPPLSVQVPYLISLVPATRGPSPCHASGGAR